MTTSNPKDIMDEAKCIVAELKAMPRNAVKPAGKVARLVLLMEERGLSCEEFAKSVGLSTSTVFWWLKGCRTSGTEWPNLVQSLAAQRGANLSAVLNADIAGAGVAKQPAVSKSVPEPAAAHTTRKRKLQDDALAVPVQMWRATNGTMHGSPVEARRVSLSCETAAAAERLWASMTASDILATIEMTNGSADLVLELADAIRAERAHQAT